MNDAPVGVFDSGVGGLTVVREIMQNTPNEKLIYFGDTARVPYGSKSPATVIKYSRQIIRFLLTKNVKAIVIACNTASALALETVEQEFDIPMCGVVKPGAKTAVRETRNGRIGVIATQATIKSGSYTKSIQEINPEIKVFGKACPLLVPLAEEGLFEDPVTEDILERYLSVVRSHSVDTLIMGCTHYPMLEKGITAHMNPGTHIVNPAHETARSLKHLLDRLDIAAPASENPPQHEYYVSDGATRFKKVADMVLPQNIECAQLVDITKY